jgi:uncharacterized protein (DUF2141 family)
MNKIPKQSIFVVRRNHKWAGQRIDSMAAAGSLWSRNGQKRSSASSPYFNRSSAYPAPRGFFCRRRTGRFQLGSTIAYLPGEETEMIKRILKLKRLAQSFILCLTVLAAAAGTISAQTPTPAPTPAPAAAPAAPAQATPAAPAQAATAPATASQGTSTLTVKVKGIRNAKGKIDVVLYGNENGFPMDPSNAVAMRQVDIDPQTMTATIVFDKLPQGFYAATVMHDEKMVGKMEFDSQGIPIEGYGVSNNPDSSSGPPTWDASKVNVNQPDNAIEISMIYWQ